ncbi:MAG: RidA family protein [Betaproteobacteria bacterium]
MHQPVHSPEAPAAIGTYSQAIKAGGVIYLSGQTPLDPGTMQLVAGIGNQIHRVFQNLQAVAVAAGASLHDAARVTVYLTDLGDFAKLNEIMPQYFREPFPARTTIQVAALPLGARVEIDAILVPSS